MSEKLNPKSQVLKGWVNDPRQIHKEVYSLDAPHEKPSCTRLLGLSSCALFTGATTCILSAQAVAPTTLADWRRRALFLSTRRPQQQLRLSTPTLWNRWCRITTSRVQPKIKSVTSILSQSQNYSQFGCLYLRVQVRRDIILCNICKSHGIVEVN